MRKSGNKLRCYQRRCFLLPVALIAFLVLSASGCKDANRSHAACESKEDCEDGQQCYFGTCIDGTGGSDVLNDTVTESGSEKDSETETPSEADSETDTEDTDLCEDPAEDCPADDNACREPVCEKGECSFRALSGESCDRDDNPCTAEICVSDTCTVIPLDNVACDLDGNECTKDVCVQGVCTVTGKLDGTPCNFDDNPCTLDLCQQGVCGAMPRTGTPCKFDDNSCTNDVCVKGECVATPLDGTPCGDDGNACTNNVCRSGECKSEKLEGTPCSIDADECTLDKCVAGVCTAQPLSGVSCAAMLGDCLDPVCVSGVCGRPVGDVPCAADENLCTRDRCNPEGECGHLPLGEGALCDDGLLCNGVDKCGPGGECLRDPDGVACSASSPCQEAVCTEPALSGGAPVCETKDLDGVPCDNGLFCDGVETCVAGTCKMTEPPCQHLVPGTCEKVVCQESDGCKIEPQDDLTPCPNSILCDGAEVCLAGVCQSGASECATHSDCLTESCQEVDGTAICGDPIVAANGQPCTQRDACAGSGSSYCVDGICAPGESPACGHDGDGSFCSYHQSCEEQEGVPHCSEPVTLGEPVVTFTLSCQTALSDGGQQIAGPTYEFSTILAPNEQSSYTGCGLQAGFTGGERVFNVAVSSNAEFQLQLTTDSSSQGEDLYLIQVTNPCATEGTSCLAAGQGALLGTADGEGKAVVVIDGPGGNRGRGTISLDCP